MKFEITQTVAEVNILLNDHYVGIPYDCSSITENSGEVIKAGTVIPANDDTAVGILLHDVNKKENPNGTIIVHGFIDAAKMPEMPASNAISALKLIYFANVADMLITENTEQEDNA